MTTLFDAIEHGDLQMLRKLMRSGLHLEQIDESTGVAPLALAAEYGRRDMVRILLRAGARPDWGGSTTPLEAAAVEGHLDVVAELIAASGDVDRPVADGFTPLITAASTGNAKMARMLLEAGANPFIADDEGVTALTHAKKKKHEDIVRMLRERQDEIRSEYESAETLFDAIEDRDLERLNEILAREGAAEELRETSDPGLRPLSRAAQLGHVALVRALLEAGAEIDDGGARTPLYCAAESGHEPVVAALLDEGAGIDVPSGERQMTPLMVAAAEGQLEIARLLIERGADAKLLDAEKKDALWHAANFGQEQTFTLLLPHIKVVDRKTANAQLAQHVESRRKLATAAALLTDLIHAGQLSKAKQWLANGLMDPDGFDEEGRTAAMLAARLGRRDLLRMLIASGASLELHDDVDGYTALIHAIHSTGPDVHLTVSLISLAGADLENPSADGRTPLMHVIDRYLASDAEDDGELRALAEPLIHAGADVDTEDTAGRTAWMRMRERALSEDVTASERRRLGRVRRLLEKYGATTKEAQRIDLLAAVTEGQMGRLCEILDTLQSLSEIQELPVLSVAAANDHWEIVSHLVGAGIDINTPNGSGETILMQAAVKGTLPIVEQLVQAGADPKLRSHAGATAASLAAGAGHDAVAKFLKK